MLIKHRRHRDDGKSDMKSEPLTNRSTTSVRAVLFDWAGTTVDYGSLAPMRVFVEIFRRRGIAIEIDEARGPMGRAKHDHIAQVARMPRIAACWRDRYGREPTDVDIGSMYEDFLPLQKEILSAGCEIIPGVLDAVAELRRRGVKIGSTTGYTRALMEVVVPAAARGGYSPETVVCADDVPAGRPAPWMNFRAAEQLGVYPPSAVVAVDDTPVGIEAGRNAGMWTVGIARTGNEFGLTKADADALPADEHDRRLRRARERLQSAGAHYVIDAVADLPPIIAEINGPNR
jgi:phosphonoacetaldehyde hydrolase